MLWNQLTRRTRSMKNHLFSLFRFLHMYTSIPTKTIGTCLSSLVDHLIKLLFKSGTRSCQILYLGREWKCWQVIILYFSNKTSLSINYPRCSVNILHWVVGFILHKIIVLHNCAKCENFIKSITNKNVLFCPFCWHRQHEALSRWPNWFSFPSKWTPQHRDFTSVW